MKSAARISVFSLLLVACIFICNTLASNEEAYGYYDSIEQYEKAFDFDPSGGTLKKIWNGLKKSIGIVKVCIVDKVIFNTNHLKYTCIPDIIGKDIGNDDGCNGSGSYQDGSSILTPTMLSTMLTVFFIGLLVSAGLFLWIFLITMGVILIMLLDVCIGTYAIAPHELINMAKDSSDPGNYWRGGRNISGSYANIAKKSLTPIDVPFLYNCKEPDENDGGKGYVYGSMYGTSFCSPNNKKNAVDYPDNRLEGSQIDIGSIYIGGINFWDRLTSRSKMENRFPRYKNGKDKLDSFAYLTKAEIKSAKKKKIKAGWRGSYDVGAFYRYSNGRVQLCGVVFGAMPVIAGCVAVPPPYEKGIKYEDSTLRNTRCNYFLDGGRRKDLNGYANRAMINNQGGSISEVMHFMAGDIHVGSTVIGCIRDLINITLVNSRYISDGLGPKPLLLKAQEGIKRSVMAILILYISLLGIKIMTSPQLPQRGEWMMYAVKFVFVFIFALKDPWYDNNQLFARGNGYGLYSGMVALTDRIADIFMQSSHVNDPVKACYHEYGGKNLLSEREIPVTEGQGVLGTTFASYNNQQKVLKMTVWDYLDCKLANYLNFSSCKYDLSSILIVWLIPAAILSGVKGLIIALIQIIYLILMVGIIIKFMHVVIINAFMVAILVLMAPIFCCFLLFDYSKEIFKNWVKHLIGYTMYPGMLFAFIALMIATFDSIFYGIDAAKIEEAYNGSPQRNSAIMDTLCTDVTSLYCETYNFLKAANKGSSTSGQQGYDACDSSLGQMYNALIEKKTILWFIEYKAMKGDYAEVLYWPIINTMLFAVMFYIFSQSVIEFFEGLFNVAQTGDGAFDATKAIAGAASTIAKAKASGGASLAKSAGGGISKALGGGRGGEGGGEGGGRPRD